MLYTTCSCQYQAWALFIVRQILGITFLAHGGQKVFGWFGGPGLTGFAQWLSSLNVSPWLAYTGAFSEFLGAVLLILGIIPELGALLVMGVMVAAIILVHGKQGYFIQDNGFEYALNLLLFSLVSIVGGPGTLFLWNPLDSLRAALLCRS